MIGSAPIGYELMQAGPEGDHRGNIPGGGPGLVLAGFSLKHSRKSPERERC